MMLIKDSSEEEPAELRRKNSSHSDLSYPGYQPGYQEPVARTLSAQLPPLTVSSEITQSQSTWI